MIPVALGLSWCVCGGVCDVRGCRLVCFSGARACMLSVFFLFLRSVRSVCRSVLCPSVLVMQHSSDVCLPCFSVLSLSMFSLSVFLSRPAVLGPCTLCRIFVIWRSVFLMLIIDFLPYCSSVLMLTRFAVLLFCGFVFFSRSLPYTAGFAVVLTCWLLLSFPVSLRLSLLSLSLSLFHLSL